MTSTTSLMISNAIRAGRQGGAAAATWIDEEMAPLLPRNIYGVTKLSAEHLCRLFHELYALPTIVLRTARFFPEEDDMAHAMSQSADTRSRTKSEPKSVRSASHCTLNVEPARGKCTLSSRS